MRLFFIDSPKCRDISQITKVVAVIYQLEQEFAPYLVVEFLPNHDQADGGGIILQAGDEIINKPFIYSDENRETELEQTRQLIWYFLKKYHNIKQIPREW